MMNKKLIFLTLFCFVTFVSCSQNKEEGVKVETKAEANDWVFQDKAESHNYGGWYCPDNLNGFPAVDIKNWESVPVVNGRLPTKEEAQNGTSLIFVDVAKYPFAKALDMEMPRLAKFHNRSTKKDEIIIVIQAVNILKDSVVGFRYLNGGNGSAFLNQVTFLSESEMEQLAPSKFVSKTIEINAPDDKVWDVLTNAYYDKMLRPIYDEGHQVKSDWSKSSKVNFKYLGAGSITSEYAAEMYGNFYIQVDYEQDDYQYVEKFLLLEDKDTQKTQLQITCGPYYKDFDAQAKILHAWADKVKALSEKQ